MNKSIFKAVGAAAVAVALLMGCSQTKGTPSIGTFTDSRDGKTYKTVKLGGKTWMAENLNYAAGGDCGDDDEANCEKYGRLHDWLSAKDACPPGWRLPSDAEWTALENAVGGTSTAGKKLKSAAGWNGNGNGTDDYGFSALPGGYVAYVVGYGKTELMHAGDYGYWWTATELEDEGEEEDEYERVPVAWGRSMGYDGENVDRDNSQVFRLYSVRCVQDDGKTSSAPAQQSNTDVTEYVQNGMKYLESGDNNRRAADYDLAVAEFDKAIRLSQNNAEAYYGRGRAYLRKGDNSRAVADYTQAIRLNPNDAISYSNRGRAYARMGDYDNAVSDFESALRIDPNNAAIKQNLEKARRREKGL